MKVPVGKPKLAAAESSTAVMRPVTGTGCVSAGAGAAARGRVDFLANPLPSHA